jgi:hypothetical protein
MTQIPGLLIVEGNADRLEREGQSREIDRLERLLARLVDAGKLRIKRMKIRTELDLDFARLFAPHGRFDVVLLVAHGCTDGAEATATRSLPWEEIGRLVAPVQPRALLAMSCMAASAPPTRALFENVPTLVAIGGSPVTLSIRQAELALLELLFAAQGFVLPPLVSLCTSLYNAGETGGVIVWRHRETFGQATHEERLALDVFAVLAKVWLDIDRLPPRRLQGSSVRKRPRPSSLLRPVVTSPTRHGSGNPARVRARRADVVRARASVDDDIEVASSARTSSRD